MEPADMKGCEGEKGEEEEEDGADLLVHSLFAAAPPYLRSAGRELAANELWASVEREGARARTQGEQSRRATSSSDATRSRRTIDASFAVAPRLAYAGPVHREAD